MFTKKLSNREVKGIFNNEIVDNYGLIKDDIEHMRDVLETLLRIYDTSSDTIELKKYTSALLSNTEALETILSDEKKPAEKIIRSMARAVLDVSEYEKLIITGDCLDKEMTSRMLAVPAFNVVKNIGSYATKEDSVKVDVSSDGEFLTLKTVNFTYENPDKKRIFDEGYTTSGDVDKGTGMYIVGKLAKENGGSVHADVIDMGQKRLFKFNLTVPLSVLGAAA
ncbi:MAG: hypothetical protein V1870_00970 [Candidatus Aenigmatarchaeota archaeon]